MSVLTTKEIMEIIPHRQPFLLIDTIEELEPGKRAVGKKCVSYNEPYFAGHFPAEPVMPGVLIVEALAQVGAVAILGCDELLWSYQFRKVQTQSCTRRCSDVGNNHDQAERPCRCGFCKSNRKRESSCYCRADIRHRLGERTCFRKY